MIQSMIYYEKNIFKFILKQEYPGLQHKLLRGSCISSLETRYSCKKMKIKIFVVFMNEEIISEMIMEGIKDKMKIFPNMYISNMKDLKYIFYMYRFEFVKRYKEKYNKMDISIYKLLDEIINNVFEDYVRNIYMKQWFILCP